MLLRLLWRAPRISSQEGAGSEERGAGSREPGAETQGLLARGVLFCPCFLLFALCSLLPAPSSPLPALRHPAVRGHGDGLLAGKIRTRDRAAPLADLAGRTLGDDLPAVSAGAGAEIQQLVGVGDHLAIVLDQQQGIAQVAKSLQCLEQPGVVAGVQTDRRFVQYIEHAAQPAADLRRPGGCAAFRRRKARGRPGER